MSQLENSIGSDVALLNQSDLQGYPRTNVEFLRFIFGSKFEQVLTCQRSFKQGAGGWNAKPLVLLLCDDDSLANYFSVSLFNSKTRSLDNIVSFHLIVIDDVGEKGAGLNLEPTYKIETSSGSFQYGYLLEKPITNIACLKDLMKRIALVGDKSGNNAARWVKLPFGINYKQEKSVGDEAPWNNKFSWFGKVYTFSEIDNSLPKLINNINARAIVNKPNESTSMSVEAVKKLLQQLSVERLANYDEWLSIGMALHNHFQGKLEGLELWEQVSSQANNYEETICQKKWDSFNSDQTDKRKFGIASIVKWAEKDKCSTSRSKAKEVIKQIEQGCTEDCLMTTVPEVAREIQFLEHDFISVAKALKKRLKKICELDLPLETIKKMLRYAGGTVEQPTWCNDWYYILYDDTFYNQHTHQSISERGFNALVANPAKREGINVNGVAREALANGWISTIDNIGYHPDKAAFYEYNHQKILNTWIAPVFSEQPFSVEEETAVALFKQHISSLFPDKVEQEMLMDFMSWIIQHPGKPKPFALLIKGTKGDGKSILTSLMRGGLGEANVFEVDAALLGGDFTDWANGHVLKVVEEIHLQGNNRHAVVNRIKPFISNKVISVHPKGKKAFQTQNTAAWIMLTNFEDAIPIDTNERRYMILQTQFKDRKQLIEYHGDLDKVNQYFSELHKAFDKYPSAICGFLASRVINKEFVETYTAPKTKASYMMVAASRDPADEFVEDLILKYPSSDVNDDIVNVSKLESLARQDFVLRDRLPTPRVLANALNRLGYSKLSKRPFVGGKRHTIYIRAQEKDWHNEKLKEAISSGENQNLMNHNVPIKKVA